MQTTNTKPDPKLSEVLAPAFADCGPDEIGTAMLWWGYLTGKRGRTWAHHTTDGFELGELRHATYGLATVARLSLIFTDDGEDRKPTPDITTGLASAIYALAETIDDKVTRLAEKIERRTREAQ